MSRVASRKTSRPFMCTHWRPASIIAGEAGLREPPPGRQRSAPWLPSTPSSNPWKPPLATGSITAAPAPSPKRMQVPRSVQSTIFESVSEPITSAFCATPPAISPYACEVE